MKTTLGILLMILCIVEYSIYRLSKRQDSDLDSDNLKMIIYLQMLGGAISGFLLVPTTIILIQDGVRGFFDVWTPLMFLFYGFFGLVAGALLGLIRKRPTRRCS